MKESVNDVMRASRQPIEQLLTGMSSGRDARTTFNLHFVLWLRAKPALCLRGKETDPDWY